MEALIIMLRFAVLLLTSSLLLSCGSQMDYDLAYAREKCPGYQSDDSPAYKDCINRSLYYLRETRRIRISTP